MARTEIVITLNGAVLAEIDRLVKRGVYTNRNQAIEAAIAERLGRVHRSRLAAECAKLDKSEEQAFAEERHSGKNHGIT